MAEKNEGPTRSEGTIAAGKELESDKLSNPSDNNSRASPQGELNHTLAQRFECDGIPPLPHHCPARRPPASLPAMARDIFKAMCQKHPDAAATPAAITSVPADQRGQRMTRPQFGKFRLGRLFHVIMQPLPTGNLPRRVLLAVALAPDKNGWCSYTIARIAQLSDSRADRVSLALRVLHKSRHVELRRQRGKISRFRIPVEKWDIGLPQGPRGERLIKFLLARTDSRAVAERIARTIVLGNVTPPNFLNDARAILAGERAMTTKVVAELFAVAHAGMRTTRPALARQFGTSGRTTNRHLSGTTLRDRHHKVTGLVISMCRPTENVRGENPNLSSPKMSGATRARAHSPTIKLIAFEKPDEEEDCNSRQKHNGRQAKLRKRRCSRSGPCREGRKEGEAIFPCSNNQLTTGTEHRA